MPLFGTDTFFTKLVEYWKFVQTRNSLMEDFGYNLRNDASPNSLSSCRSERVIILSDSVLVKTEGWTDLNKLVGKFSHNSYRTLGTISLAVGKKKKKKYLRIRCCTAGILWRISIYLGNFPPFYMLYSILIYLARRLCTTLD